MKVIIADILSNTINGKQTGHYFALARNYLEIFGEDCLVAGGPVYKQAFSTKELIVLPNDNIEGDGLLKLRCKTFANARYLFKVAKKDIIVLQQCTTITTFICLLLFCSRNTKVFFIQYNQSGLRHVIGRFLFKIVKKKIIGVICPNDQVGKAYGLPYCVVPDYIYTNKAPYESKPYSEKKYDFCMIGRISDEKGIIEVAKLLVNTSFRVLIAGRPVTEQLKTELVLACGNATNIKLHLDFISEVDYKRYLQESRYTILNYQGEYSKRSSGVVYDTLFAGVPVIGCKCNALKFIEDNELGTLYENIEEFDFNSVLNNLQYDVYLNNIRKYRQSHQYFKYILKEFLGQ